MISLKKYLDDPHAGSIPYEESEEAKLVSSTLAAYRSALSEMGTYSVNACPALGNGLREGLGKIEVSLTPPVRREAVESTEKKVTDQLQDWGQKTASHYRKQTSEVKEMLLVMTRAVESVGERDQRAAGQMNEVTTRLQKIATLEDLTQIRASIEKSAEELKTSINRMAAEGIAAIKELKAEVSTYQAKLEEAELIASRDALTGLGSRLWVEGQITRRIKAGSPFCVAIIDINGFKPINDEYGHLAGDEVLKQFSSELQSVCRSSDLIGRWGGDEFIVVLDCDLATAKAKIDRLREWVCGSYKIQGRNGSIKFHVDASIGLSEHLRDESMKGLLERADASMYRDKADFKARATAPKPAA
jgi:diguanylate cyclase (GGDEF)-like protein